MNGDTLPSVFPLHVHISEPELSTYIVAFVLSYHRGAADSNGRIIVNLYNLLVVFHQFVHGDIRLRAFNVFRFIRKGARWVREDIFVIQNALLKTNVQSGFGRRQVVSQFQQ
jgi:hypothetical protein